MIYFYFTLVLCVTILEILLDSYMLAEPHYFCNYSSIKIIKYSNLVINYMYKYNTIHFLTTINKIYNG